MYTYTCTRTHVRECKIKNVGFKINGIDIEIYKECNYYEKISLLDFYQEQGRDPRESSPSFLSVIRAESFRIIVQTLLLQSDRLIRPLALFRFAVSIKHRQQFHPADFSPRYKPARSAILINFR